MQLFSKRLFLFAVLFAEAFAASACGAKKSAAAPGADTSAGKPLHFTFAGVDGEPLDSGSTRGRVTVLLFVTTFDVASQSQAKRLQDIYRMHAPRINAAAIVLEAPRYADLARSFGEVLGLSYPIAMADKESLKTHPQLHYIEAVPAWLFLDREGRISAVGAGALEPDRIEELVVAAE
jgi:hypothetical protein